MFGDYFCQYTEFCFKAVIFWSQVNLFWVIYRLWIRIFFVKWNNWRAHICKCTTNKYNCIQYWVWTITFCDETVKSARATNYCILLSDAADNTFHMDTHIGHFLSWFDFSCWIYNFSSNNSHNSWISKPRSAITNHNKLHLFLICSKSVAYWSTPSVERSGSNGAYNSTMFWHVVSYSMACQ